MHDVFDCIYEEGSDDDYVNAIQKIFKCFNIDSYRSVFTQ